MHSNFYHPNYRSLAGLALAAIALTACGPIKKPAPEAPTQAQGAPSAPTPSATSTPSAASDASDAVPAHSASPSAPVVPVEVESPGKTLKRLEFFVLPAEEGDAARPRALTEADHPARRALEVQDEGVVLVFRDPIVLNSGDLFLSFREGAGERRWTSVFYQDGKRGYERLSFHFDPERRIWFLPLSRLFSPVAPGSPGNAPAEPGQPRELRLDLLTASGHRFELGLVLPVVMPLPDGVGATEIRTLSLPVSPEELGQPVRRGGLEVGAGSLANPFARSVTFYLRAREAQPFRSDIVVWRRTFAPFVNIGVVPWENNYSDPNVSGVMAYTGGGLLQVGKLAVHRRDGSLIREIALRADQWGALPLQPGEQVRVSWIATAAEGERTCGMPQPGLAHDLQSPADSPYVGWREVWRIGWAHLSGAMSWEARLAGSEIPAAEVTRDEPTRPLRPWISISRFAPLPLDASAGDPRYNRTRQGLECQGVL